MTVDPRSKPRGHLAPEELIGPGAGKSLSLAEQEAMRLATLREGNAVRATACDGLAVMAAAELGLDYQAYMAGLAKLITAGEQAKRTRDLLHARYGPAAVSL